MGRLAARLAKAQDPVTHIRRQNVSDNQRYPDQEVNFQGNAPIQISHEDYFGAQATASPELDDLEAFQSSANGGFASRKTTQVPNLTNLIGGDYFGKDGAVAEEDYEGGSQDGEFSDEDHQDDIDPMLGVMAQQDGAGGGYDGGRIDGGRVNMSEEAFSPFEEIADTNLPKGAEAMSDEDEKEWKAKESSAAIGGMNKLRLEPKRNLRDLEQLPFAGRRGAQRMLAGFGVRPGENTRERTTTPDTIGQGLARRNLGLARAQFNKSAGVLGRLTGPQHAGTSAVAPSARAIVQRRSDTATIRARVARMTRAKGGADRLEDAEEGRAIAFGNRRATASLMNYTALDRTRDRRGDPTATTIAEAPEAQEDDNLTSGLRPDYFSADSMVEEDQPAPGYDAFQDDPLWVAAGGMTPDQERAAKELRDPKKAKMYARMAEIKAQREAAPPEVEPSEGEVRPQPKPGLFSRIGGALAKAGRVVGNALSSAGRGLKSLFGFGKRAAPMNAPDTSTAAERARNARMDDAESEYERQQSRPGMAELQNALDDPVNQDTMATASQAGINLRAPIKDDELEQLQRMMQVDSEPARDEEAKWYPEVMESRMYDDYVSPRDDEARVLPDASGMKADHNHFKEPAEAVDARYKAKRKAGVPSPESYTDEQADDLDLWNERFTRYQGEAHEYQEGGGVEYSGGMAPEDRKQISQQFFQKFQENPRLSFKPYARNRQEDVYDAQDAGQHNPLYPAPLPGASEQETSMDVDPGTGEKIGYSVDDDYFMSPEDKKAKWEQKQEENRRMIAIEAPFKKKRLEAEEKRRREELSRLRERQDVGYEGDLKANEEAMGKGASHTEAIHAGALDGLNENYFSQTSTEGTAPIMEGNAPEPPKAGTKKSSRLKFWK